MAAPSPVTPPPTPTPQEEAGKPVEAGELPSPPPVPPQRAPKPSRCSRGEQAFKISGSTLQDDLATLLSSPGSADVVRASSAGARLRQGPRASPPLSLPLPASLPPSLAPRGAQDARARSPLARRF